MSLRRLSVVRVFVQTTVKFQKGWTCWTINKLYGTNYGRVRLFPPRDFLFGIGIICVWNMDRSDYTLFASVAINYTRQAIYPPLNIVQLSRPNRIFITKTNTQGGTNLGSSET